MLHPDTGLWFLWTLAIINVLVYVAQLMVHKMGVMAYVLMNLILLGIPLKLFGIEYVRVHFTWYAIGFVMPRYWKKFGGKKWITWIGLIGWPITAMFWMRSEAPLFANLLTFKGVYF